MQPATIKLFLVVRYIEGKLIETAQAGKRAMVMNSVSSGSALPEADRAEMDVFIERVLQLLPVLGIHHFSSASFLTPGQSRSQSNTAPDESSVLHLSAKGVSASGLRSEEGFTVIKGSRASKETTKTCPSGTIKNRKRLLEKGVIIDDGDSYLFTEDYEFSSPSSAGAFVSGRSTNGLVAWITADKVPLKQLDAG